MSIFEGKISLLPYILPAKVRGRVRRVIGLVVEASAMPLPVGSLCCIQARLSGAAVEAEVIGFREDAALLMPLGDMQGVGPGDLVECLSTHQTVAVGPHLLGRVLDSLGRPLDGKGPVYATAAYPVYSRPPDPVKRPRIREPLPTGIRAIDAFVTVGRGQRIGIFSGTGVGKSVLLGMISRFTAAEVAVIALVGERGREVREFLEKDLGSEGLRRSVVVVATGEQPPPLRVRAPFVATAIAEYFRDQGCDVALIMDSVTRMAMAQRDIGNSVGEVAATRGYTPSVFALLPRLLERAGRSERGSITGFYSVLVEGDDLNEPISDAARGVLDGHIVLTRRLAHRGHYPAVDILESISRLQIEVATAEHVAACRRLKEMAAIYRENEDMINLGAYPPGANLEIDRARMIMGQLNEFLRQGIGDRSEFAATLARLRELAEMSHREPPRPQAQPVPRPPAAAVSRPSSPAAVRPPAALRPAARRA